MFEGWRARKALLNCKNRRADYEGFHCDEYPEPGSVNVKYAFSARRITKETALRLGCLTCSSRHFLPKSDNDAVVHLDLLPGNIEAEVIELGPPRFTDTTDSA